MSFIKHLAKNGGMIACGDHLVVFVGTDIRATPKGGIFLELGKATEDQIREALLLAKQGRRVWPVSDIKKRKSK